MFPKIKWGVYHVYLGELVLAYFTQKIKLPVNSTVHYFIWLNNK